MKSYNAVGYFIIVAYLAGCVLLAPAHLGPWLALAIGSAYFLAGWFLAGLYLSDLIHLGIAHRSLDYKDWFIKTVTVVNNTFGLYVNPLTWVNRHRLHHKHADRAGDPNKLHDDGFWRTLYLCLFPYKCEISMADDAILKTWPFRLASNPVYAVVAQTGNLLLLWWLVQDWKFTLLMWLGLRVFAVWVNMIQNYWTHTRTFGYRRYDVEHDNAMNIGEWFPVTATFSACLQNNHHHIPSLLRLSHHEEEWDFGFATVKLMKKMGLVQATPRGTVVPKEVPLATLNF